MGETKRGKTGSPRRPGDGLDGRELGAFEDVVVPVALTLGGGVGGNLLTDVLKAAAKKVQVLPLDWPDWTARSTADPSRPCAEAQTLTDHLARTAVRDRCRDHGLPAPGYDELVVDTGAWEPGGRVHGIRNDRTGLTATVHIHLDVRSARPRVVTTVNQASDPRAAGHDPVVTLPDDLSELVKMIDLAMDDPSTRDLDAAERLDRLPQALRARFG